MAAELLVCAYCRVWIRWGGEPEWWRGPERWVDLAGEERCVVHCADCGHVTPERPWSGRCSICRSDRLRDTHRPERRTVA
jgi:hypothetical protein